MARMGINSQLQTHEDLSSDPYTKVKGGHADKPPITRAGSIKMGKPLGLVSSRFSETHLQTRQTRPQSQNRDQALRLGSLLAGQRSPPTRTFYAGC